MSVTMNRNQKLQLLAAFKSFTPPAALKPLFLTAFPDLAEGRPPTISAAFSATELHHCPKNLVALLIVLEAFTERVCGDELSKLVVSRHPKFFSQVSCEVRNFP
jgi:hypothetical protein